jgi:hypothetical protein
MFNLYLKLGFDHIADITSYDHILFITCLCAVYLHTEWKKILVLVTAFTIGHTTTLALATLDLINIPVILVEILIPVTIIITALWNLNHNREGISSRSQIFKYATALFFGLIHGLGFSSYLKGLLGNEESLIQPLFAFNLGIEAGQLAIVAAVMIITLMMVRFLKVPRRDWIFLLSGAGIGISLTLIIDRWP